MQKETGHEEAQQFSAESEAEKESVPPAGIATVGLDLGDKQSCYCVLDGQGAVIQEGCVGTNQKAMAGVFGSMGPCRIALKLGTHSPWMSRLLHALSHAVVVVNIRRVKLISACSRKDDRVDAQTLARLARVDPQLLRPIRPYSTAADLSEDCMLAGNVRRCPRSRQQSAYGSRVDIDPPQPCAAICRNSYWRTDRRHID